MNIKIGKWSITSDTYNYCVTETSKLNIDKKTNTIGKVGASTQYFGKIDDALHAILEHEVKLSEANTIVEFIEDWKKIKKQISDEFKKETT